MPVFSFDKILKIIQIILSVLEMAVKAFIGFDSDVEPKDVEPNNVD